MNKLKKAAAGLILVLTAGITDKAMAQLDPMGAQYFQNQYLANPALAGLDEGLVLNGGFRKQYSTIPGSPTTQTFTAGYQMSNRVGWGLNFYNDAAGLIKKTRAVGSYAYRLPLNNEGSQLHFGISLGFMNERIAFEDIEGDQGDITVGRFNQRETYVDGDFGMAYTDSRLNIQAAVPNMKSFFGTDENTTVDRATFFSSLSYKLFFGEGSTTLEPKVVYRGVKGHDNLVDAGANLMMSNGQLIFTGMYHSSQSATFGMGINYNKTLTLMGMYTTETAAMQTYANGNFEIGLKYRILKKEKK
ncbi:type IX secretion system membrane protein PorP/SprF [Flavihumibacter sp. R14]|nr:type IX secretion system membrane protein PorP/SprF [Flavihumibacter soli]